MGVPRLPDWETLEKQGSISRLDQPKGSIKRLLRINDEQIAVNRFKWYNLPRGITGNQIERMLYYRGQVAWFYLGGEDQEFYVLPFVLNGEIDLYGRYKYITPLPFNGKNDKTSSVADMRKSGDPATVLLADVKAKVLYDPIDIEDVTEELIKGTAVILSDYTRQLPQQVVPKYKLTEGIIELESNLLPYANTALALSTGVSGMRVEDQSEQWTVEEASRQIQEAALSGKKWIAIANHLELQELTGGNIGKAEDFLLTMQSMDNFRLGVYGVETGGLFEKKAHTTDLENSINLGTSSFALEDALYQRQQWADIINSFTGFGIYCEPREVTAGADLDFDMEIGDGYDSEMETMTEEGEEDGND